MATVSVVPSRDKQYPWNVKVSGRNVSRHRTKAAAVSAAKPKARGRKAELLILRRNGTIQQKHSYGRDPRSIPG